MERAEKRKKERESKQKKGTPGKKEKQKSGENEAGEKVACPCLTGQQERKVSLYISGHTRDGPVVVGLWGPIKFDGSGEG